MPKKNLRFYIFFDNFIIKKNGNKLIYKFAIILYFEGRISNKTPDSKAGGET